MLFSEVFGVEIFLEGVPVHVADGEIGVSIHDHTVLVDLQDLREVDDIRTVNPHEIVGEPFFHLLHGEQGDDGFGLVLKIDLQVFAHGLYIADVADADLHDAVLGLQEDGVIFSSDRRRVRGF